MSQTENILQSVYDASLALIIEYQKLAQVDPDGAKLLLSCTEADVERFASMEVTKLLKVRTSSKILPLSFPLIKSGTSCHNGFSHFLDAVESEQFRNFTLFVENSRAYMTASCIKEAAHGN
ncbi:hypothetical protein [uncultured Photobacterium sp.]|uniref:hypothetical protein n=1 Tax=uncultured Photobacterium sp. TaxID=173973 RepID=UPI00262371DD|nr:hypothetical protein [uncultured Photobacterium sp.]